jgi:tetratricopeptide (TPR) repeat protein
MIRRAPLLALAALVALPVLARGASVLADPYTPPGREPARKATFWERVQSPHVDEIRRLVGEATFLRQGIATQYWDQYLLPTRRRVLRDALDRYEHALALDPRRLDLRLDAAHTALEAGEYERAAVHYLAYREKTSDNALLVTYDLAEAYARLGRWADTIDELEPVADDPSNYERARFLTLLGEGYMARGRLDDAIDALERSVVAFPQQYGSVDQLTLALLAVAYDRDEQLGRAHEMIDQLRAIDPQFYVLMQQQPVTAATAPSQRTYIIYAPPSDRHYVLGLFYEAQGRLAEAAASWRAYLDSAEPGFARRAQQHLAGAQRQLAELSRQRAAAAHAAAGKPKPRPAAAGAHP